MALTGLIAQNNLSDVSNIEACWNNLGNGISFTITGVTTTNAIVRGKDVLALEGINTVDTQSLVFLAGLTGRAQSRLNESRNRYTRALNIASSSLTKASPVSSGVFSINGSLSVSSLRVNNLNVRSISASPFSAGVTSNRIEVGTLVCAPSFKLNVATSSGTLSNPSLVIPIDFDGMYLYIRAENA